MKWQPPIPAGAFSSPEAIKVNTALPLLGWFYDEVSTNGWLELNLHEVAGAMNVSYHTVKKWWGQLRDSDFVTTYEERGRNGIKVKLADKWIDWRILSNRETVPNPVPIKEETVPEQVPNEPNRELIGRETRPNKVPKNLHIRSHTDQESNTDVDALYQPMFAAIAAVCRIDLKICTVAQRNQIAQTTKALRKAGKLPEEIPKVETWWYAKDWRGKKGDPPRPAQLQEIWQQASHTNGHNPERAVMTETDFDKGF